MRKKIDKRFEFIYVFSLFIVCFLLSYSNSTETLSIPFSIGIIFYAMTGLWYFEGSFLIGNNIKKQLLFLGYFFLIFFFLNFGLLYFTDAYRPFFSNITSFSIAPILSLISCLVCVVISEEIFFRKWLFGIFWVDLPLLYRFLFSSLIFGIFHGFSAFPIAFLGSIVFCTIYLKFESLLFCMVIHFFWDAILHLFNCEKFKCSKEDIAINLPISIPRVSLLIAVFVLFFSMIFFRNKIISYKKN